LYSPDHGHSRARLETEVSSGQFLEVEVEDGRIFLLIDSPLFFGSPMHVFFEVIEEGVGYEIECFDNISDRNKGESDNFSDLTIEGLVLLVLLL
jgi:hypothetical protein